MSNRTLSSLLFALYNIGLFGAIVAVPARAFLLFELPNPNATGRALSTIALASAIVLVSLAVGCRIAMRVFYNRVCGRAFAQWEADPGLGETVDGALLAELASLTSLGAWNARQFRERKAAATGIDCEEPDRPSFRRYRFPRPGVQEAVWELASKERRACPCGPAVLYCCRRSYQTPHGIQPICSLR